MIFVSFVLITSFLSGSESISNLFSSYFSTVYANTSASIMQLPDIPCSRSHLPSTYKISLIDVENGLSSLNNVKSAGPDGLPVTFLFNIRYAICFPLWLIFCRSLKDGIYSSSFKMSSITYSYIQIRG